MRHMADAFKAFHKKAGISLPKPSDVPVRIDDEVLRAEEHMDGKLLGLACQQSHVPVENSQLVGDRLDRSCPDHMAGRQQVQMGGKSIGE